MTTPPIVSDTLQTSYHTHPPESLASLRKTIICPSKSNEHTTLLPPDDRFRILIDRLWPRGLTKDAAKVDLWQNDLAPSTALRNWFQHKPKRWEEFQMRYAKELEQKPKAVEELWQRIQQGPVTLLFGAKHQECNHAVALKAHLSHHYG